MLSEEEAKEYLIEMQEAGKSLATAVHTDLRSIKQLLRDCLEADIAAMIGPCSFGG